MKKRGDNIVELSSLGRPVNVDGEIKSTKILKNRERIWKRQYTVC